MSTRQITKNLAGLEDLALGAGTAAQTRNGTAVQVTEISGETLPSGAIGSDSINTALKKFAKKQALILGG